MRQTESFQIEKVTENQKILIYGAAIYGEIALRGLEILGLRADYFVDREYVGEEYLGLSIISPDELIYYKDDIVIIASLNYFSEILEYLKSINISHYYDMESIMQLNFKQSKLSEYALEEVQHFEKYKTTIENCESNNLVINHCEIVVTEKCTLRCRDCANLMQFYKNPENLNIKEIIDAFNLFLEVIDILCELRILGGEPFVYKDLEQLLKTYIKNKKIKKITVYTNSTIVPNRNILNVLKDKKIVVHLSNYGVYSRNINKIKKIFEENHITYYAHNYEKWRDFGGLEKRNYSENQLKKLYKTCVSGKCYTFYRGKLYLCPRAAHGERLGIFQNRGNEYVDFSKKDFDIDIKRKELKSMLVETQILTACNYCNGESVYSKEIDAAIQL